MRVMGVGIATVDIVNRVDAYPVEDAEVRATAQRVSRGGNAANTLAVLSQLGHDCVWCGTLAEDAGSWTVRDDMARYRIDMTHGIVHASGTTPTSYITLSQANGSRTIVHYRDLPEMRAAEFPLEAARAADWIHFEGREPTETAAMIHALRDSGSHTRISVEVEKPRLGIEALFEGPELILFSRVYALSQGFDSGDEFLTAMAEKTNAKHLFCAWGEQGGYALQVGNDVIHRPAFDAGPVVDTLGAGDVFNAAVIDSLARGDDVVSSLEAACKLAGRKCAQQGMDGLVT